MKKILIAVACLAFASSAFADVSSAITRVVVTGTDVNVRVDPSPKSEVYFQASAPAEYLALKHTVTYAGTQGNGSTWYELIGLRDWDEKADQKIVGISLENRSAKGALLSGGALYISSKFVQEIELREGDADAVRENIKRNSTNESAPQNTKYKFLDAIGTYMGSSPLEMASLHNSATIHTYYDTDDEDFSPYTEAFITDKIYTKYLQDARISSYIAQPDTNIGGIILGKSSEANLRKLLGKPTNEDKADADENQGFEIPTLNLSGGVPIFNSEAPKRIISFQFAKMLNYDISFGDEGFGNELTFYVNANGQVVAIRSLAYGWR